VYGGEARLLPTAEVGWWLVSTTLLIIIVVKQPDSWRALWLALLVINAAVVGYRVKRMSRRVRAGRYRPDRST
jgi:purine-cytosine permease-like protein